ncbi:hypothetical protein CEUSTIGMA_g131.t1 [Chlamydomonas eustigma]|uniref:Protein kinase domain-containing protein n=1 Tax=Chlamydomonas eustigma TaxID=1157962 RepID=A0A250WPB3_9CHLO|nr:hypothetical protein CEUSTIGMA_g131.t1 [Chlamydomonas eustigma]|eukprot:GAX72675.1 hypothetical protein CEUSTIGMA_g131.t1 [Chlamydomonas eustigma]
MEDPLRGHPRYIDGRLLVRGTYRFVCVYFNVESRELVAIKFLSRGEHMSKYTESEILNHRILRQHPHVIEFKEVFLTSDYICIAMEYASGGNLFRYVQSQRYLPEIHARFFFQQLIFGIDYCHRKGVVNRDIKLENVLLQPQDGIPQPLIKICDFGYSKAQVQSANTSTVGTVAYMAPEVLTGQEYDGKLSDIWSCGVLLYIMLFGHYPFDDPLRTTAPQRLNDAMMQRIVNMQWAIPSSPPVSAESCDLLRRLLVFQPSERLSMADIQLHPWFTVNLPPNAVEMNELCLANNDYEGMQSVESIQALLGQVVDVSPDSPKFIEKIIDEEIQQVGRQNEGTSRSPN